MDISADGDWRSDSDGIRLVLENILGSLAKFLNSHFLYFVFVFDLLDDVFCCFPCTHMQYQIAYNINTTLIIFHWTTPSTVFSRLFSVSSLPKLKLLVFMRNLINNALIVEYYFGNQFLTNRELWKKSLKEFSWTLNWLTLIVYFWSKPSQPYKNSKWG